MEIKSPWTMGWSEFIDDFISFIKENLPPKHELQSHELFPGIKVNGEPIFAVALSGKNTAQLVLKDMT